MTLTATEIRNAKPSEKTKRLFDSGGLYLEIAPSGGKWWRLKYRVDGREKRLSLGTYPDTGLKEAREKRDTARKQLAAGVDPSATRQAEKSARRAEGERTLIAVATAWLGHRDAAWKDNTRKMIRASLENDVFPTLGHRPVSAIQPAEIRELVVGIEARGAGETAGRVFQRIRAIYRYGVAHGLVQVDPSYPLKLAEILKPRKVTHRASLTERDVPDFLHKLNGYQGDPTTLAALQLLMLTAVRPGELRGAEWAEIDEEKALWRIPGERMKMKAEHLVPLSRQALSILSKLRPLTGTDRLVFPSPFYPGKPMSDGTLNSALSRLGYKGIATAHGFRTLFSTAANEAGMGGDLIEKQLAHEDRDEVRAAYNRALYLEGRKKLMQWWADHLDALRKGADIIQFRTA